MKKALITGIAGFAGSHLTDLLLQKNIKVAGFYHPDHSTSNLDHIKNEIDLFPVDLLNVQKTSDAVKKIKPDYVFHLAASSSPAQSFKNPALTLENNLQSQINLLEALISIKSDAKILIVGSAEEYGIVEKKYEPVDEQTPIKPISPYAVSKVTQDFLGYQYFVHYGLNIIRVRPFNHIGPRQSIDFVVPAFASQIVQIEKKGSGKIKVGNINSFRDFTDVRDVVRAYLLVLDKGEMGDVYNIGSGKLVKIENVLKTLISLSPAIIEIVFDKSRIAPTEVKSITCNYSKLKAATGWKPEIPLKTTLFDTINYERNKLKS
jgi:GDP-4-dehydro-6-deoxy-D-mannose reductase